MCIINANALPPLVPKWDKHPHGALSAPLHLDGCYSSILLMKVQTWGIIVRGFAFRILRPQPLASIVEQSPPILARSLLRVDFAALDSCVKQQHVFLTQNPLRGHQIMALHIYDDSKPYCSLFLPNCHTEMWGGQSTALQRGTNQAIYFITLQGWNAINESANLINKSYENIRVSFVQLRARKVIIGGTTWSIMEPASISIVSTDPTSPMKDRPTWFHWVAYSLQ